MGAIERHAAKLVEGLSAAAHGEAEIALTVAAAEHAFCDKPYSSRPS